MYGVLFCQRAEAIVQWQTAVTAAGLPSLSTQCVVRVAVTKPFRNSQQTRPDSGCICPDLSALPDRHISLPSGRLCRCRSRCVIEGDIFFPFLCHGLTKSIVISGNLGNVIHMGKFGYLIFQAILKSGDPLGTSVMPICLLLEFEIPAEGKEDASSSRDAAHRRR